MGILTFFFFFVWYHCPLYLVASLAEKNPVMLVGEKQLLKPTNFFFFYLEVPKAPSWNKLFVFTGEKDPKANAPFMSHGLTLCLALCPYQLVSAGSNYLSLVFLHFHSSLLIKIFFFFFSRTLSRKYLTEIPLCICS